MVFVMNKSVTECREQISDLGTYPTAEQRKRKKEKKTVQAENEKMKLPQSEYG